MPQKPYVEQLFPGYRVSPDGTDYRLFEKAEDVPEGYLRETPESFVKKGLGKPKTIPNPFDHDGDGKPGGSLPKAARGRPKKEEPPAIDL